MKTMTMKTMMLMMTLALMTSPMGAQSPSPPVSVAGTWVLTAVMPQGEATLQLVLRQEGASLTGTLVTPHGEVPVEGQVKGREIRVGAEGDAHLTIVATLTDDGTLTGSLASPMGDARFTAERKNGVKRTPGVNLRRT